MGRALRKSEADVGFGTESSSTSEQSSLPAPGEAKRTISYETSRTPVLPPEDVIREAVGNHLRYLRSTGKMRVSAHDVARSLHLSVDAVKKAAIQVGATLED